MKNYLIINYISIINSIDEWTKKNVDFFINIKTLLVLLTGIVIGLVIASTFYAIILFSSIKKKEREIQKDIDEISDLEIAEIVKEVKKQYVEETEGLPFNNRFELLRNRLFELIQRIATVYYPESKYPIYELTIEELIMFMQYLSTRIDVIFEKKLLRQFKKISISQIFRLVDTKKKIDDNKAVKAITSSKPGKVGSFIMNTVLKISPTHWIKNILIGSSVNFGTRKIALLIMDIVADETNKTYSKSIFKKASDLEMLEIEKNLQSLEGDESDE